MDPKPLLKYLESKNISASTFADICGVSRAMVNRWILGKTVNLRVKTAEKIERVTRGEVPYESLTSLPRKKKKD